MKMLPFIVALAVVLAIPGLTLAAVSATKGASKATERFVKNAAVANSFEIEASKLALDKSQNQDVKDFAQQMIDDHTKAGADMKTALSSSRAGASLTAPDMLDSKHQKELDKLKALNGAAFDKQYTALQANAHKEAVSLFSDYASKGDDPELKKFASQTLPTLEQHLQHVKGLQVS